MDTLILLVIIAVIGGALLKKYQPSIYSSIKNKVLSLIRTK